MMKKFVLAAVLAIACAGSAFAQTSGTRNNPPNNGVNGLNSRGTVGDAPAYGAQQQTPCAQGDARLSCQQAAGVPQTNHRSDYFSPNSAQSQDNADAVRGEPKAKNEGN